MATLFGNQNVQNSDNQEPFVDRRSRPTEEAGYSGPNRRQFSNSYNSGRPEVDELARAIDEYKLQNRRRFITYEELYDVMAGLGYRKDLT